MEETDVRISEIKKDAYEFKRDIVTGAENFRTGKTIAEKAAQRRQEAPPCRRPHRPRTARQVCSLAPGWALGFCGSPWAPE